MLLGERRANRNNTQSELAVGERSAESEVKGCRTLFCKGHQARGRRWARMKYLIMGRKECEVEKGGAGPFTKKANPSLVNGSFGRGITWRAMQAKAESQQETKKKCGVEERAREDIILRHRY